LTDSFEINKNFSQTTFFQGKNLMTIFLLALTSPTKCLFAIEICK